MNYRGKELKTIGEVFEVALQLAKENTKEAEEFFYQYVQHISSSNNWSWDKSIEVAKSNLGYFAGYYDRKTYDIIHKVYDAQHPIFGCNPFDLTSEEAFNKGKELSEKIKNK